MPEAGRSSCHERIFSRSSFFWKAAVGVNSIATPVKCRDASSRVRSALAARRVVHGDPASRDLREHHEVVHVPVQHRGQAQLAERLERHLHAARGHAHRLGDLRDVLEGDALQRGRKPQPHRREVGAVPVERGHHRQACDAALGRFALQDDRDARLEHRHQSRPFSCSTGSKIHSSRVRFSSSRSAFTSMPGRSANSCPSALTDCFCRATSTR